MAAGDVPMTWQHEPCPHWCAVQHSESDHERDRAHQGSVAEVPVVAMRDRPLLGRSPRDEWYATELAIVVQRRDGSGTTGLYVGDGAEQRLELDLSSARRVVDRLQVVLRRTVGDGLPPGADGPGGARQRLA